MKGERIFVTGMGVVSALGNGVDSNLSALLSGTGGVGRMRHLRSLHSELPVGEVQMTNQEICSAIGSGYDDNVPRTALLGALAVKEALENAGISKDQPQHMALVSGTTVGGMDKFEERFLVRSQDCGSTTEFAARLMPVFDFTTTISTACSSAANAIMSAADLIRTGRYDIAVAGGSESLSRFHLNGFNSLMILDHENCRPFDDTRSGLNLGEGAGYIVLESESSARRRGAVRLCKLAGYGNACDAYHQTASSPDGEGAFLAMTKALEMSGLEPSDIDYVNAHGTGTPNNDLSEGTALERVFGKGKVPPVSSTKGYTGHTTSASGGIEAVFSILSILNSFHPASLGYARKIESLSFEPVTCTKPSRPVRNVLTNAFGFGGNDSAIIFSRTED